MIRYMTALVHVRIVIIGQSKSQSIIVTKSHRCDTSCLTLTLIQCVSSRGLRPSALMSEHYVFRYMKIKCRYFTASQVFLTHSLHVSINFALTPVLTIHDSTNQLSLQIKRAIQPLRHLISSHYKHLALHIVY